MARASVAMALACAAASGCWAGEPPAAGRSLPIINGEPEPDYPGVVALMSSSGDLATGFCSGAVIGPYAVLTAKHCVDGLAGTDIYVGTGQDVSGGLIRELVQGYEIRATPGPFVYENLFDGTDVAIVLLTRAIEAPAYEIATAPPSAGEPAVLVGYGRTDPGVFVAGDFGRKHSAEVAVSWVGPVVFETRGEAWSCHGDSGSPVLAPDGRVLGVTSYGVGERCDGDVTGVVEVSQHEALIADALEFVPPCLPTDETCDGRDNDCNGVVDDGCFALGEPCEQAAQCDSGRCETIDGTELCTSACDPAAGGDCPEGLACEASGCGEGRCAPVTGELEAGQACTEHADCRSRRCVALGESRRCGAACVAEGERCPGELVCEAPDGACGSCVPEPLAVSPRLFGGPCAADGDCASGRCEAGICTRPCDGARPCPGGSHCREGLCVEGPLGGPGDRCVTEEDCGAEAPACVTDGDRYCADRCNDIGRCPVGLACVELGEGEWCLPEGASLGSECTADGECRSGRCEAGACTRVCSVSSACPEGFACESADGAEATCRPRGGGGCSASGAGAPLGAGALLLLAWALRRTRRGGLR